MTSTEKLTSNPLLKTLSESEQKFVIAYCESGRDKMKAAKAAWPKATEGSQRTLANRTLVVDAADVLIDAFFLENEQPTKDEMVAMLWRRAKQGSEDGFKCMALIADLKGWKAPKGTPEPQSPQGTGSIYDQAEQIRGKS